MQKRPLTNKVSRARQNIRNFVTPTPMVDPRLLDRLISQGVKLAETPIAVLGLRGGDLKRLKDAGIINLEQLAKSNDTNIFNIPHFGIMKVNRIKIALRSYFSAILTESNNIIAEPSDMLNLLITDIMETDQQINADPDLASFSLSLNKVEKRMTNLESRLTRIKNNYQKIFKQSMVQGLSDST